LILLAAALPLLIATGYFVTKYWEQISWVALAFWGKNQAYPTTTINGKAVGESATATKIDTLLAEAAQALQAGNFTLTRAGEKWEIPLADLGVRVDLAETAARIRAQSQLGFWDRLSLALKQGTEPLPISLSFHLDVAKCQKTLAGIEIPRTKPQDASLYYDGGVKIKEGVMGEEFRPELVCNTILQSLNSGAFSSEIQMFTIAPAVPTATLQAILPSVQEIISQPVILKSGQRHWEISPKELFELLTFTPREGKVKIDWSETALNRLLNKIAAATDNNNPTPKLGKCETLIWAGGYRLDKTATKNFFKNLGANQSRTLTLKVDYFAPSVKKIQPVANNGSAGTIYLTYDDAMTYSHRIMDLAECYGVKVTFFVIGQRARLDAGPMRRAVANGHAIQSHGYEHDARNYATGHDYSWQYRDIRKSIEVITAITKIRPTYFRPPGGNHNQDTYKAAAANGVKLILWGITSIDTVYTSPVTLCRNVLQKALPNRSVLAHSTKSATVAAFPCIVEGLSRAGYRMAALR